MTQQPETDTSALRDTLVQIEITDEMIEAGEMAFSWSFDSLPSRELVVAVYTAMRSLELS